MTALDHIIRQHIADHGALSVADFMDIALQHPEHGYYRSGDPLGQAGDFITAPEVSQMFGEMIGIWLAEIWRKLGSPSPFTLLELGAGRGTLMQDALRATAKVAGFHQSLQLRIVDSNTTLREKQKEKLSAYNPQWIDDLQALPAQPTLVITNEFFDALPIRQFEKTFSGWQEKCVAIEGDCLTWTHQDMPTDFPLPARLQDARVGTIYEISPLSMIFMKQLSQHCALHGGAVLAIDYGYAEGAGSSTLQALYHHTYADVLERAGGQDITAHVDFSALHRAAQEGGCPHAHYATQGDFLRNMGIEVRASQLKLRATEEQKKDVDAALHRLTHADEMGTLFKVLAVMPTKLDGVAGF